MTLLRAALRTTAALATTGAATFAYAWLYESRAYTLRQIDVPVLSPGSAPLRVLHLSDLHMRPQETAKQEWLRDLGRLLPDLVVLTGDVLSHPDAGVPVLKALGPLLDTPGGFVPGNNDYYAPQWKNPLRYVTGTDKTIHKTPMDWAGFALDLSAAGWHDLTNTRATVTLPEHVIDVRGVDDPYTKRDRMAEVAGPADPDAHLRLGLLHAPEPRVLDAWSADGVDLMLAGHTHGGQVRLPGYGAIVTNCGIDRARAKGLSAYESSWLHVSPGLGTSPYAPIRFACRPEATLLRLTARS